MGVAFLLLETKSVIQFALLFGTTWIANLIFSLAFRDQEVPEHVFGWNLIGATLGGVIEHTSLAIGCNALALIVAAAYTLAFGALVVARAQARAEVAVAAA